MTEAVARLGCGRWEVGGERIRRLKFEGEKMVNAGGWGGLVGVECKGGIRSVTMATEDLGRERILGPGVSMLPSAYAAEAGRCRPQMTDFQGWIALALWLQVGPPCEPGASVRN